MNKFLRNLLFDFSCSQSIIGECDEIHSLMKKENNDNNNDNDNKNNNDVHYKFPFFTILYYD